jgi:CPA2 family monovalent cation:H+ antiporter-2
VVVTYLLGTKGLSWVLDRIARAGRELFMLSVVLMAVGLAVLMERFGLSLALGAFIAGLIVGQSNYGRQVQAEVVPLRDIFATFFFVTVGMLVDISYVAAHPLAVVAVVAAIVGGKTLVAGGVAALLHYPAKAAIRVGFLLANIGEFSFLLAQIGLNRGVVGQGIYSQVIAGAVISIILSPLLIRGGNVIAEAIGRLAERRPVEPRPDRVVSFFSEGRRWEDFLTEHVVICGYDGVGHNLAMTLTQLNVPYVVVELNPAVVARLQRDGVPVIFGDAASPVVLSRARLTRARTVAITIPDPPTARDVVDLVRRLSPKVNIVVRQPRSGNGIGSLSTNGTVVVHPDFETSQEFVRHIIRGYGMDNNEIIHILSVRRAMASEESPKEVPSPFREYQT